MTALCPIHQVNMREYSNDQGNWWSHKTDDPDYAPKGYCSGKPPKNAAYTPHMAAVAEEIRSKLPRTGIPPTPAFKSYSGKTPEEQNEIKWQHSQEMGLRYLNLAIQVGLIGKEELKTEMVDKFTRHFFNDIKNANDGKDVDF